MRIKGVFVILLVASMVAPVGAHAADPVVTGGGLGTGWKAYEVTMAGSPFTITYDMRFDTSDREPQSAGTFMYNADNSVGPGFRFTGFAHKNELVADVYVTDGVEYHVEQRGDTAGWWSVRIVSTHAAEGSPENPKTIKLLTFTAAAGVASTPATWTMTGSALGITLGDQTSGDETYLLSATDFDTPNKVHAQASVPAVPAAGVFGGGPEGHAVVAGRKVIDVDGVFIGGWTSTKIPGAGAQLWEFSAHQATVTNATGAQRDCTINGCYFNDYKAPGIDKGFGGYAALPPGRYTFEHTGAGAGLAPFGTTLLWGMDVTFPQ